MLAVGSTCWPAGPWEAVKMWDGEDMRKRNTVLVQCTDGGYMKTQWREERQDRPAGGGRGGGGGQHQSIYQVRQADMIQQEISS